MELILAVLICVVVALIAPRLIGGDPAVWALVAFIALVFYVLTNGAFFDNRHGS